MPLGHTSTFQVRHYECDAYGHLTHANYLRYVHEARLDALASAGIELDFFTQLDLTWRFHKIFIEFMRPLYYRDMIKVDTRLVDFGTDCALWSYDFCKDDSTEVFARASSEVVCVNVANNRPAPIPEVYTSSVISSEGSEETGMELLFPKLAPRPPGAFTMDWRIEWRDVDTDHRLNSAAYLDYLMDFVMQAAADRGWTYQTSLEEGFAYVVRRHWLQIDESASLGDDLELATWLSDFRRSTIVRNYTIHRKADAKLVAQARTLWVCVNPKSGRPVRIPERWAADFAPQISSTG